MKEIKLLLKILGSVIGLVIGLIIMTYSFKMISAKSTIESLAGLLLLILLISSVIVIGIKIFKSISKQLKTKTNEKTI